MPCEIASFSTSDKYDMSLFFINFYISLVIIITILILANTIYNYYVYNNIVLDKIDNDTNVIENGAYPPKGNELSPENKILIGETVDYKLFISLLLDQDMYYNDKYFTLNITNILLDVFVLITIVLAIFSAIYIGINSFNFTKPFVTSIKLKYIKAHLEEYIKQYCYFINNNSCNDYHIIKSFLVFLIIITLGFIYILRRSLIPSINYSDYLKFVSSDDTTNTKQPKNIENMLNIICDDKADFLKDNQNITKIINKLNGHNIHTVNIIPTTTPIDVASLGALKTTWDNALTEYNKAEDKDKEAKKTAYEDAKAKYEDAVINKFIYKIKEISETIKEDNKDNKDNKDLDFVKLVIVYLNNKKIYNSNASIPGGQLHEAARTYAQSLLNIITNVIPFSNNLFSHFKTGKYDIENILMGSIPVSIRGNIKDSTETCPIEYSDFDTFKNNHNEKAGCYYTNYLFQLKETRTRLKTSLDAILGLSIISTIIFILALFYYIYINYNDDNMRWANMTAIKMQRLSGWNPLNWLNKLFGIIMFQLNKSNY
ncbi:MAG: hypothetical protein ACOVNU_04410 [Candidatus Kapaibacteriota bacterium]